ncbi:MAG: pentapeptide repeat-containing protein [Pseudanabaena sp. CAN_BIN31]|nr:pentapeptide repeat-containing protein [Pseudanabaena sp. CAN_BIN31]
MKIINFTLRNFIFKAINILLCLALILTFAEPAFADVYVKAFLQGSDFSGRSLQGYQFNESDLRNTSFVNADAQGVSFFAANMKESNLTGANLSYSTLDNARLDKANLTNAVIQGSFAYGTSFNNVIIDGADFTDVDLRPPVRRKLCQSAKGQNPVTGKLTRETLECE